MKLKNKSSSHFVVFVKSPVFFCRSVLTGEAFTVDDQLGYTILSQYPEHIEKVEELDARPKAFAKSPSDKSLEVKV
jgi:hypothetical protein